MGLRPDSWPGPIQQNHQELLSFMHRNSFIRKAVTQRNTRQGVGCFGKDSKQLSTFHPTSVGAFVFKIVHLWIEILYILKIMVQGLCGAITSLGVQLSFCGLL
jgi:hypothetical protein